jgi:hypothetical protein
VGKGHGHADRIVALDALLEEARPDGSIGAVVLERLRRCDRAERPLSGHIIKRMDRLYGVAENREEVLAELFKAARSTDGSCDAAVAMATLKRLRTAHPETAQQLNFLARRLILSDNSGVSRIPAVLASALKAGDDSLLPRARLLVEREAEALGGRTAALDYLARLGGPSDREALKGLTHSEEKALAEAARHSLKLFDQRMAKNAVMEGEVQ